MRVDTCWLCDAPERGHGECVFFPCTCAGDGIACAFCVAVGALPQGDEAEMRERIRALASEWRGGR